MGAMLVPNEMKGAHELSSMVLGTENLFANKQVPIKYYGLKIGPNSW